VELLCQGLAGNYHIRWTLGPAGNFNQCGPPQRITYPRNRFIYAHIVRCNLIQQFHRRIEPLEHIYVHSIRYKMDPRGLNKVYNRLNSPAAANLGFQETLCSKRGHTRSPPRTREALHELFVGSINFGCIIDCMTMR